MEVVQVPSIQTLKTRLNMHRVYGNFKGGYEIPRLCPHCLLEEDTTEHLLLCPYFGQTNLSTEDLHDDTKNVQLWKQINERIEYNLKWG